VAQRVPGDASSERQACLGGVPEMPSESVP
jgi:hypothetical protein